MLRLCRAGLLSSPLRTPVSLVRAFRLYSEIVPRIVVSKPESHQPLSKDDPRRKPMTVNSELPDPLKEKNYQLLKALAFFTSMTAVCLVIFNYEKTTSPIINSTFHFMRRSTMARTMLGNSISFDGAVPWVHGTLNQMKGDIDVWFNVKGDVAQGCVVLRASRDSRNDQFTIHEWTLTVGEKEFDLLRDESVTIFL
ncbi:hypothetical protein BABINDRAFT_160428 [Babjeviella inositovora NRRL Y-12698]|uniref:Cytochrome c oxidase assembly factor 1 n=1 Tax=Babjeviella inositovora NRRL Y-12698 TaxID=984486 RepID=A0A1E3QVL4_9ASCO|nr:uncharacterized protein BABINDRAFT_160428 [Babjeviella inositovora NRRL Y-12698]ODQ81007.1 hypothetical protein BABINDRAFT_160428 [Babjeviella inositovora NRRL Y-12698]